MQVCLRCGAGNAPDAPECDSCGLSLAGGPPLEPQLPVEPTEGSPVPTSAPTTHPDDITTRYDEFAVVVEKLRIGNMAPEAFIDWLAQAREKMWERRDAYMKAAEETLDDDGQTQIAEAAEAILDFDDAIEEMWKFTLGETGVSGLDTALSAMWQANQRINEAMRKNREFRSSLEEDWGFM